MFGRNGNTYSVQVRIGAADFGHIEVNDDVDTLDINTTTDKVSGHQDALLEVLELLNLVQPRETRISILDNKRAQVRQQKKKNVRSTEGQWTWVGVFKRWKPSDKTAVKRCRHSLYPIHST